MSKPNPSPSTNQTTEEQAEQRLNQLVSEIRLLEQYYNEITQKIQNASAEYTDMRSAIQSIEALAKNANGDFLIPIGGGLLLPASNLDSKKTDSERWSWRRLSRRIWTLPRCFSRLAKESMTPA